MVYQDISNGVRDQIEQYNCTSRAPVLLAQASLLNARACSSPRRYGPRAAAAPACDRAVPTRVARVYRAQPLQHLAPPAQVRCSALYVREDRNIAVHRMLAQGMELPDDTFVNLHNFDRPADSSARAMK